eukprot:COSAG02_NODE_58659_length_276_cov_1.237288_1_plen_35_part_01
MLGLGAGCLGLLSLLRRRGAAGAGSDVSTASGMAQ